MRITVIGGTGRIGSKLVTALRDRGHEAVAAALDTGVDTISGSGVPEAVEGAAVVVDVSNAPSFDDDAVLEFFRTSTVNLLSAGRSAGVEHHVVLSIVGTERLSEGGYYRAKAEQERLVAESLIPYSIVHSTQFFEFLGSIAASATTEREVRLPPVFVQPIAADDVAGSLANIATGPPANGIVEIAGPEMFRLDQVVQRYLDSRQDGRCVVPDLRSRYFGSLLQDRSLMPGKWASLGSTRLGDWLDEPVAALSRAPR